MSCSSCGIKFNLFRRTNACSNCGLTFCTKCLRQKCKISKNVGSEVPICEPCFNRNSVNKSVRDEMPPPDIYLKRLEELKNPSAPPITIYKHDSKMQNLKAGLSTADQQLVDRLEKLKEDERKAPLPSENEIRNRLAKLKGEHEYVPGPSKPAFTIDHRSDQEQVDSLLKRFQDETEIARSHDFDDDTGAGIASLRGDRDVRSSDSEEDDEIEKITNKIAQEIALDGMGGSGMEEVSIGDDSQEELPWCVLCNGDATVRCLQCNDLYCDRCNTEAHSVWDETKHTIVPYRKKINQSSSN